MKLRFRGAVLLLMLVPCAFPAVQTDTIQAGRLLFQQKCAFCHGRDAGGGETGPDLTSSELVKSDVDGNKIGVVVRNGRPEKGMPRFAFPDEDISALAAFIHNQVKLAASKAGGRKGVAAADLQSGNAEAGKAYFNGPGGCSGCHSATGDLAHVASKYKPLKLELRMLYPEDAESTATVTLRSGETVTGTVMHADEFTIALREKDGSYHSWRTADVTYKIDDPSEAHWNQLPKYTDADIHNLIAYLETLR